MRLNRWQKNCTKSEPQSYRINRLEILILVRSSRSSVSTTTSYIANSSSNYDSIEIIVLSFPMDKRDEDISTPHERKKQHTRLETLIVANTIFFLSSYRKRVKTTSPNSCYIASPSPWMDSINQFVVIKPRCRCRGHGTSLNNCGIEYKKFTTCGKQNNNKVSEKWPKKNASHG